LVPSGSLAVQFVGPRFASPPTFSAEPTRYMHARDLVELAATASLHGPLVIASSAPLPQPCLEQYWSGSKCRLDRWGRALKRLSDLSRGEDEESEAERRSSLGMLEEIVTGDVLARVWAAVLTGHDRRNCGDSGAIARTILVGQQEARNRAMSLLVNSPSVARPAAQHLNRLRRRAECWSDLLVGHLSVAEDLSEFGAEPARAREFANDFREEGRRAWSLLFASLKSSFSSSFDLPSPNADLNAEIAAGVIACFGPEVFDSTGLLRSQWMSRLQRTSHDTACMIESLFAEERDPQVTSLAQVTADRDFFKRRFSR
jgi:hypothetical protein